MTTWHDIERENYERETRALNVALEAHDWSLTDTARALGVPLPRLQRMIVRYGLGDTYRARNPGRGRPRKS